MDVAFPQASSLASYYGKPYGLIICTLERTSTPGICIEGEKSGCRRII